MKKIVIILLSLISVSTFAQGISGGFKAGLNFANQKFKGDGIDITPDGRTSFHVGAFATIMVSDNFGLQPELLYNSVGSKVEIFGQDVVNQFNYLSVPVMFRYNPIDIFNIHAGPQFGFLLNAQSKYENDDKTDIDGTNGVDVGFGFGAGLDLPMGVTASLRYNLGLTDIYDNDDDDSKITNNVFQISVGYKLFGK